MINDEYYKVALTFKRGTLKNLGLATTTKRRVTKPTPLNPFIVVYYFHNRAESGIFS